MKKLTRRLTLLIVLVSLVFQFVSITPVFAEEGKNSVTILFTHDMHDNFYPFKTMQNGSVITMGGYARLQSAINEEKTRDPEAILVDAGDYSMGTPFQTIYQTEAPELRIMGQMGYDAVTLGNHEFDYRAAGLTQDLTAAVGSGDHLPLILSSNVTFPLDKEGKLTQSLADLKAAMEAYGVLDFTVLERNGIKIGIFGLMGKESASMAPMSEVVFEDEIQHAKRVVKILKEQEKVDLILCLSHSGTDSDKSQSEDEILAKAVPEINIIISGHTHTKLEQPIVVGNTIIGSSEDYGRYLGVIKVSRDDNNKWNLNDYQLRAINENYPEDSRLTGLVENYKKLVQEKYFDNFYMKYDEVVATSSYDFQTTGEIAANHCESTLGNLISDAYVYAVEQAEGENYIPITASIVPCGTIRGTIKKGDITTADAFSISSLGIGADKMPGYPIISVYLTGKELKTATEVDASIQPLMDDAQLFMSGVEFAFNPNRLIFNKITSVNLMKPDGSKEVIDDKKLYRVVCGLYSAQMLSVVGDKSYGLMSIIPKDKDGAPITDFEKQIVYTDINGSQSELKEWYAVVQYLQSFYKENNIPRIPETYNKLQGRKIVEANQSLTAILSNPNQIALAVYIGVPMIFVLIIFVLYKVLKLIIHRRKK
jgi:5'-nucleotidase / UDP-sugar diphosphatase